MHTQEQEGKGFTSEVGFKMSDHLCASSSLNPARVSVQVKVWFQNRRTKYKRQKLEEEGPDSQQKKKGNHHINRWRIATKQASSEDIDVTSEDWKRKKTHNLRPRTLRLLLTHLRTNRYLLCNIIKYN